MPSSETIGARWQDTLERVQRALSYEDNLNDREIDFLIGMEDRVESYRAKAFVSVDQLNFLSSIEAKLNAEW